MPSQIERVEQSDLAAYQSINQISSNASNKHAVSNSVGGNQISSVFASRPSVQELEESDVADP